MKSEGKPLGLGWNHVVWPEYLRIGYFPGGWMVPLHQELCVFLIINESVRVVTRGRRVSIALCIHVVIQDRRT